MSDRPSENSMFRNLSTFGLPLSGRPSELIEMALSSA